ncbi:BON domain-containing protein [Agrobacterium sp. rho-13.3]|uniref:BON domain-containing protein n=1 Tax=Agrobacterium sp. rho-13.3 TaxID=3072980 RepID=UPI002A0D37B3|nr:BON domain-containing protein [Agrobacterium sp. rho-13.3]MDX8309309.1 BON domain-containing protein [Agrobacterium sp. rho-13.3]
MLFPVLSTHTESTSGHYATGAAIKSLLAYAHGLEDCQIDVEVSFGIVMLTGKASSVAAVDKAIQIASDISSRPVFSDIDVCETHLALPVRPAHDPSKDRRKSGNILYMKRDTI